VLFLFAGEVDSNPFKCGADEHRRRGLDRAEPLFSFASCERKCKSNPPSPTNTCGLNDCNPKTARVSSGFPVFIPKIIARFSWMQNTYMMDSNDRAYSS